MKLKIFKNGMLCMALLLVAYTAKAQDTLVDKTAIDQKIKDLDVNLFKKLDMAFKDLNINLNLDLKNLDAQLEDLDVQLSGLDKKIESSLLFAEQDDKNLIEKTKNYSKSYSIGRADQLLIDNQYGKVTINTWNKNEFKVDVEIKAAAKDNETAQKLIDGIQIKDQKSGSLVSFKTDNNTSGNWGRNNVRKIEINYTVYMPTNNPISINNKYGAIILPDFEGLVKIDCSYGSFTAQALKNTSNNISVRYGSPHIKQTHGGNLDIAYSSLQLEQANNLNTSISYGSAKIGNIKSSGNIDLKYSGGFELGTFDKNLKSLNINAAYSKVSLNLDNNENFNFDVNVSYAGFNYPDSKVTITEQNPEKDKKGWSPNHNYKGYFGKKNSDTKIIIQSSYGGINFK